MTDFAALAANLPLPLQPQVLSSWTIFCDQAGERHWDDLPESIRLSAPSVWAASPFIASQCARRPGLLFDLADTGRLTRPNPDGEYETLLRTALSGVASEEDLMIALRRFRNREMVRIAWRDIAGWAPLDETLADVSFLAEACIATALDFLFALACEARDTPVNQQGEPQNLIVLGMGKLGAWELNFSSDIDLIFAFRDDGILNDKRETSYSEFYTRLARSLVKVLDGVTEEGFVFRVDTRLRPFGESGPLVMSFDAMEAYYQSQAREWERYAMIKARTVGGDRAAGKALEEFLRPFVYRRYLDYRALGELRDLKQKISQELKRKDRQDNVKLGPGGIREIEFIGQAFQLIRGGFEKPLRERRIQRVLKALAALGLMPVESVATLLTSYAYLRTVENRLQQYADRQTHDLPTNTIEQLSIATTLNHEDWDHFKRSLDDVRQQVHEIFRDAIAAGADDDGDIIRLNGDSSQVIEALHGLGWENPAPILPILERFHLSHAIHRLSSRGASELKRLLPKLLREIAVADTPALTLERLLDLIEAIASRNVYLTLLAENPPARKQLVKLAASSPWICHTIALHPLLLDELLDPRSLYSPLTSAALQDELKRIIRDLDQDDQEQIMNALRQFKQAHVLRVAAADLAGVIPIMVVSDYLTWIAETLVAETLCHAWRITVERHGVPPSARHDEPDGFGVIAYGKMGGLELGYGSDLDLVFLYDGDGLALTNGSKPITCAEFYGRIAKRMVHFLTTNTPAGLLYETDLRLRPSGGSGLLVSSMEAYYTYQMQNAWTWEQQALVKARFVAGDLRVGQKFSVIREKSLGRVRDREQLRAEVREMREKMRESLGLHKADVFHLKHDVGGIVDIEFLVQFGVLSGAHDNPALTEWTDVVRILESLTRCGFIGADDARLLKQAYCVYREQTHRAALQEASPTLPGDDHAGLRERVHQIWQAVMERKPQPNS